MKRLVCFFLGLILVVTCCIQSVSAYDIPPKEEFQTINDARACKTYDEFIKYMKDNYNVTVDGHMSVYNFNTVKNAAAGIEYVINKYPALKGKIKTLKAEHTPYNYALGAMSDGNIYFYHFFFTRSDEYLKNWLTEEETAKKKEFHPSNTNNVFSYGMHEAAHLLTGLILEEEGKDFSIYTENVTIAKKIIDESVPNSKLKKQKMREVSQYAATNEAECIAEAICDYLVNGDEAAELSIKIAEYFKKYEKTPEDSDVFLIKQQIH